MSPDREQRARCHRRPPPQHPAAPAAVTLSSLLAATSLSLQWGVPGASLQWGVPGLVCGEPAWPRAPRASWRCRGHWWDGWPCRCIPTAPLPPLQPQGVGRGWVCARGSRARSFPPPRSIPAHRQPGGAPAAALARGGAGSGDAWWHPCQSSPLRLVHHLLSPIKAAIHNIM